MASFAADPVNPPFDYNVFDWTFLMADIIPIFENIDVYPINRIIEQGQAVVVVCRILDTMTTPGAKLLFDPGTTPQIQIFNPDDTTKVALTDMNFVSTGLYNFQHQTLTSDTIGVYTALFTAVDGTMTGLTERYSIFTLK